MGKNDVFIGVETSTTNCSVCLFDRTSNLDFIEINDGYSHSENIGRITLDLLERNNLVVSDLSAIVVDVGPGSYTGLRIGVSFAKGLAFAHNIPIISISSLELMYLNASKALEIYNSDTIFIPMIDARRMEVYCQVFNNKGKYLSDIEAKIIDSDSFKEFLINQNQLLVFGNGASKFIEEVSSDRINFIPEIVPSALFMRSAALLKFDNQDFEDTAYFEPFYLKEFIAGKPKRSLLLPD